MENRNNLVVHASEKEPNPFCWLKGNFVVNLRSLEEGYAAVKGLSINWESVSAKNLTMQGCPFQNKKLILIKELNIKKQFAVWSSLFPFFMEQL